jgi:hypothetical protein
MPVLSDKQRALLHALREVEAEDRPVEIAELAEKSTYSEASIRTYFTKKLEGVLVFRDIQGWRVEGALRCAERAFGRHMTQKAGTTADAVKTENAWQMALRKLLYEGLKRGYRPGDEERAILGRLDGVIPLHRRQTPPPSQTKLFED